MWEFTGLAKELLASEKGFYTMILVWELRYIDLD
jgi:hypothetical protein